MNKATIAVLIGTGLTIATVIGYTVSAKFTAAKYEVSIFAQDESMQSTWGMSGNTLKMSGMTVNKYPADFIKGVNAQAERYKGDKASMMLWVKESQNQLSPELYKNFLTTIEKVYARREAKQLSKISVVQEYRAFRDASVKGLIATSFFNYPTEKCLKIEDRIISNKKTKTTWETGNDEVENPFN